MKNIDDAVRLIERLKEKYIPDWHLEYFRAKYLFGQAVCYKRILRFNKNFLEQRSLEDIEDLTLHEIAHALNFERNNEFNHNHKFKTICNQLGCRPSAKSPIVLDVPFKYTLTCENGCFTAQRNRIRNNFRCRRCKGKLIWRRNESKIN